MESIDFYFFERHASHGNPAGVTVSKTEDLPEGDFGLDEFIWPDATLWFITEQAFSNRERTIAHAVWVKSQAEASR